MACRMAQGLTESCPDTEGGRLDRGEESGREREGLNKVTEEMDGREEEREGWRER